MKTSPVLHLAVFGIAVLGCSSRALAETIYSVTSVDVPGASSTYPFGLNNRGDIVGSFNDATGSHAFFETGGKFTTINPPGSGTSAVNAYGVNDSGQIVLSVAVRPSLFGSHSFLYDHGIFSPIDAPGPTLGTQVTGINNSGQIIGYFADSARVEHAYVETGGTFTLIEPPGTNNTIRPSGISNDGRIVGSFDDNNHGFLYDAGIFTTLDVPGTRDGFPQGINTAGGILVDADLHSFVYSGGNLTPINVPGALGGEASSMGINDIGQVVGYYTDTAGHQHGFLATPASTVPEPRTLPVLAASLCVFFALARQRKLARGNHGRLPPRDPGREHKKR